MHPSQIVTICSLRKAPTRRYHRPASTPAYRLPWQPDDASSHPLMLSYLGKG
jgi:hypothetical protein